MENLVFVELKRRQKEIYCYQSKNNLEADFLLKEGRSIKEAIQVSQTLKDLKTKNREINGLVAALKELKLKQGLILTEDEEEVIEIEKKKIIYSIAIQNVYNTPTCPP